MTMSKTLKTKPSKGTPANPARLKTPVFKSETEEAAWWDKHAEQVTDLLIKYGQPRLQTQSVTMRLPVQDLDRAVRLAGKKGVGYQTLIKSLLHESLKRETEKASQPIPIASHPTDCQRRKAAWSSGAEKSDSGA
jgi:predicted DNA binding CopG/RHH family protein